MNDKLELDAAIMKKLAAPFSIRVIKWKPQVKDKKDPSLARLAAFIDARDVMDRLDSVVGYTGWSFNFDLTHVAETIVVVKGYLTIGGVTKCSVGEYSTKTHGGDFSNAFKGAESDALKRSAVHFGVFRYAYDLEMKQCKKISYNKWDWPPLPYIHIPEEDRVCEITGRYIPSTFEGTNGETYDSGRLICDSFKRYEKILCYDEYRKLRYDK